MNITSTMEYVDALHQDYINYMEQFDAFIESTFPYEYMAEASNGNEDDEAKRKRDLGFIGRTKEALVALGKKIKEVIDNMLQSIKNLFSGKKEKEITEIEKILNNSDEFKHRNITLIKIDDNSKAYDKAINAIDKEIAALKSKKSLSEDEAKKIEERIKSIEDDCNKKVKVAKAATVALALPIAFAFLLKVVKKEEEDAKYDKDDFDPLYGYQDGMNALHMRMIFKMMTSKGNLIEKKHLERNNFVTSTLAEIKGNLKGQKPLAVNVINNKGQATKEARKEVKNGKSANELAKEFKKDAKKQTKQIKEKLEKQEKQKEQRKEVAKKVGKAAADVAVAYAKAKTGMPSVPDNEFDESVNTSINSDEYVSELINFVDGELKTEAYDAHKSKKFYFSSTKDTYKKLEDMMSKLSDESVSNEDKIKIAKDASDIVTELIVEANKIPDDDLIDAVFDINLLLNGLNKLFAKFKSIFTFTKIVLVKRRTQRNEVLSSLRKIQKQLVKEILSLEKEIKKEEKAKEEVTKESSCDNIEAKDSDDMVKENVTVGEYLESIEKDLFESTDEEEVTEVDLDGNAETEALLESVVNSIENSSYDNKEVTVGEYLESIEKDLFN